MGIPSLVVVWSAKKRADLSCPPAMDAGRSCPCGLWSGMHPWDAVLSKHCGTSGSSLIFYGHHRAAYERCRACADLQRNFVTETQPEGICQKVIRRETYFKCEFPSPPLADWLRKRNDSSRVVFLCIKKPITSRWISQIKLKYPHEKKQLGSPDYSST